MCDAWNGIGLQRGSCTPVDWSIRVERTKTINHQTAIFRQVNKDKAAAHHDALEFPDGRTVLLTHLDEDQAATVLQLPAQPSTAAEVDAQKRVTYVG